MDEENQFDHLSKKEALDLRKEIVKLNKFFGGIKTMKDLPDVLFIVDTRKEKIALAEGKKLGIKIVAMVDTNSDPDGIDFPIPANDDSIRTIQLLVTEIANAIIEVAQKNAKAEEAEKQSEEKKEA